MEEQVDYNRWIIAVARECTHREQPLSPAASKALIAELYRLVDGEHQDTDES